MKFKYFKTYRYDSVTTRNSGHIHLLCGFNSPRAFYLPAIRKYRKAGFDVILYRFHTKAIRELDAMSLPDAIEELCTIVASNEKEFSSNLQGIVLGNSMGSVFAWHAASRIDSIEKIVANTGYALISKHIYEDKIGTHWRKKLIKDGISQNEFHSMISKYEPISVFDKLKDKKVLLCMNRDDNVIGFDQAALFLESLKMNNINYTYIENHSMKHGTAILKNLMSKSLIDFLRT